jgi:hypothetical protein
MSMVINEEPYMRGYARRIIGNSMRRKRRTAYELCLFRDPIFGHYGMSNMPSGKVAWEYDFSAMSARARADEGVGLASLAVEFPVRGVSYFFTTPRGEVAITARSVSHQFIETMRRIGLALAVIAIGLAIYATWPKWHTSWFTSRVWSTLAIVMGSIGTVAGVLPILAVVVLVAGVAAKIHLRRRKRVMSGFSPGFTA